MRNLYALTLYQYMLSGADEYIQAAAAERAGDSVIFVNYDDYVGEFNGRFCEAGVDESTTASNTRYAPAHANTSGLVTDTEAE
jgi:hypothetical protein